MAQEANLQAIERLKAARAKSLKIMQMDNTLNKYVNENRVKIESDIEGTNVQPVYENAEPKVNTAPINMNRGMIGAGAANVPSIIKESFMTNPPANDSDLLNGVYSDGKSLSVLDEMEPVQPVKKQKRIQETRNAEPQVQYTPQQVDYPMIRTIVEEIVRKYTSSLGKKLISESVGSSGGELTTFMVGKTFKFLDSKGNIYEATLKKTGNINDKKRVNG